MSRHIYSNKSNEHTHTHTHVGMHVGLQNTQTPQKPDTSFYIPLHTLCCETDWYRPPLLAIANYTMTSYCCPISQSQPYYGHSSWGPPPHWPRRAASQTQFVTISSLAEKNKPLAHKCNCQWVCQFTDTHTTHTHLPTCTHKYKHVRKHTHSCAYSSAFCFFLSATHARARGHTKVPAGLFEMQTPMSQ